jgi:LysM repeat protein
MVFATPIEAVRQARDKAKLVIEQPVSPNDLPKEIPVRFNPAEYQLQKQNSFADINIPGLETPPIQFVRGSGEKLTTELLVDTSDTMKDVRVEYVDALRGLMNIQKDLHAPPIVRFVWGGNVFRGVIESLTVTYVMFRPDGVPVRAKLAVSMKEYRPVEIQVKERPTASPDFDKTYTVIRGDTISGIAEKVYRDATVWRTIAKANDIRDPRRLAPGQVLLLPRLR